MVHGSWFMGHGSWVMGHGSWVMGHGSWVMGHGSWVMGQGYVAMIHQFMLPMTHLPMVHPGTGCSGYWEGLLWIVKAFIYKLNSSFSYVRIVGVVYAVSVHAKISQTQRILSMDSFVSVIILIVLEAQIMQYVEVLLKEDVNVVYACASVIQMGNCGH